MPLIPRSSYYDNHFRQSAALIRARRPYLFKNIATGLAIFTFAASIYAYTIKAVGVDDFDDVKPANQQVQSAHTPNVSAVQSAGR